LDRGRKDPNASSLDTRAREDIEPHRLVPENKKEEGFCPEQGGKPSLEKKKQRKRKRKIENGTCPKRTTKKKRAQKEETSLTSVEKDKNFKIVHRNTRCQNPCKCRTRSTR